MADHTGRQAVNELERAARLIAAEKMGLVKDSQGLRLPDDLWRQALPQASRMAVIDEIVAERSRQEQVEGWTPEHDDRHDDGEMALAAACYACHPAIISLSDRTGRLHGDEGSMGEIHGSAVAALWPWDRKWWKPKSQRRNLVRAAALIIAEIERLDRTRTAEAS